MFFDMFTKTEIKYDSDEYKIFEENFIKSYDCKFIEEKLNEFITTIRETECVYLECLYKGLTKNYELKEEMFTLKCTDTTQRNAFDRIETAEELKLAYGKFKFIFDNLFSYREKVVFVEMILLKRGRDLMKQMLRIGSDKVSQTKNSALIKIGINFNWDNIKK